MFISSISGTVSELTPNNQTRFQCTVTLTLPLEELSSIEPGRLIATENVFSSARDKRYTVLQLVDVFPVPPDETGGKRGTMTLSCTATPIGEELLYGSARKSAEIVTADTFPAFAGTVEVLDDDTTRDVIHHIAPDSRVEENGTRIDIGTYRSNPNVKVGLDAATLLRGNAAVISARPRARATITNSIIQSLLQDPEHRVHIVYCDVNNTGTMGLAPLISGFPHSSILCLNDKFVPASVFVAMKNPGDRTAHKRAVLDYLDMMILPSVLELRRHDFTHAVSNWMRENRIAIFRPNEQTVDGFINDIRVDILDGVDEDVEEYISELMNGIAETFRNERFTEKNTREMLDMVEEFSQESKSHSARRTLYDLKAEIQSVFETYSKDIPSAARVSMQDVIAELNNDERSSLLVVQGQKPTDIMRFIGNLTQTLIEERVKRLKIRTPVLFIFNNIDEYVGRNGSVAREAGSDRFYDVAQTLLSNGRRHGLGFCLTLESAAALDRSLARRIQSYFIGPITFVEEPARIADLLNLSEDLVRPAVRYEDGDFLFTSADSPYHRRVPLPVHTEKNTSAIHTWLDALLIEQERRRQEYFAQEEERRKRSEQEREERRRQQEKAAQEKAKADAAKAKAEAEHARNAAEQVKANAGPAVTTDATAAEEEWTQDSNASPDKNSGAKPADGSGSKTVLTTRDRRKRGGRRVKDTDMHTDQQPAGPPSASEGDSSIPETGDFFMDDAPEQHAVDSEAAGAGVHLDARAEPPAKPGEDSNAAAPAAPPRKTARGHRGRGRSKSAKDSVDHPAGTDARPDTKAQAPSSDAKVPRKDAQVDAGRTAGTDRKLMIEDFDPDAGRRGAETDSRGRRDTTEATGSTAEGQAGGDKKKAPRRPARRRGPRGKKSDDQDSKSQKGGA
jgi:hypothetical protein